MWTPMVHQCGAGGGALLALVCLFSLLLLSGTTGASTLGYSYGGGGGTQEGLHSPEGVVRQLKVRAISKLRLYDADHSMLRALGNSGIEVMVGVRNDEVESLEEDPRNARAWVESNILPFVSRTNITTIALGNEGLSQAANVVQAMRNVHRALVDAKLSSQIKVSTPLSVSVLSSSFPPSWGYFSHELMPAVLQFLSETQAPFLLNLYPYREYQFATTKELGLDYHLLNPIGGFVDPNSGLRYDNVFDATVDAVYSAMASLNYKELSVIVSETGWPVGAASTVDAETYHLNLVNLIHSRKGTPLRPSTPLHVYTNDLSYANLQPSLMDQVQEIVLEVPTKHRRLSDGTGFVWCVAKDDANVYELQTALNWTCSASGGGVNCNPTYAGGNCFLPNTIQKHSSWAFNMYYNSRQGAADACNFSGTATVTIYDPSTQSCLFQGTSRALAASAAYMHEAMVAASTLMAAVLATYLLTQLVL